MAVDLDDTSSCPLGVRSESCGIGRSDLVVAMANLGRLGGACFTLCPRCAASDTPPRIGIGTAVRLVGQHCAHLGIDVDAMAALLEGEGQ